MPGSGQHGYPVSLNLAGKRCIVVGGGKVATRKTLALVAAGACVTVIAPQLTSQLAQLRDRGLVDHLPRRYQDGDLAEAFVTIAATDDPATNLAVAIEARRHRALVNVADDASLSDFSVPAVLRRGDMAIAVTSGGNSPAMAGWVRDRLAELLPVEYEELLSVVAHVRAQMAASGKRFSGEVWRGSLTGEVMDLVRRGDSAGARAQLIANLASNNLGIDADGLSAEE